MGFQPDSTKIVLVLGATGFIGGQIALAALEADWRVRALRRSPQSVGILEAAPVTWVDGNLEQFDTIRSAMQGVDSVFHAAGYYPTRRDRRSVADQVAYGEDQTENVILAARSAGVKRLVYTSTLTTIGSPPPGSARLANETGFYTPGSLARSGYYEAKHKMEQVILAAAGHDLEVVVLNPTAVFGPGDVHLTLGGLLLAVRRGKAIVWVEAAINVIDVRDVAIAHVRAATDGESGERYILGGENMTLRDALTRAASVAGVPPPRFEIPLGFIDALIRLDDALPFVNLSGNHMRALRHWQGYDTTKAVEKLGLTPRPFEITVQDALAWFKERGKL